MVCEGSACASRSHACGHVCIGIDCTCERVCVHGCTCMWACTCWCARVLCVQVCCCVRRASCAGVHMCMGVHRLCACVPAHSSVHGSTRVLVCTGSCVGVHRLCVCKQVLRMWAGVCCCAQVPRAQVCLCAEPYVQVCTGVLLCTASACTCAQILCVQMHLHVCTALCARGRVCARAQADKYRCARRLCVGEQVPACACSCVHRPCTRVPVCTRRLGTLRDMAADTQRCASACCPTWGNTEQHVCARACVCVLRACACPSACVRTCACVGACVCVTTEFCWLE